MSVKPKVLMLGWEYPPVINGGLGVACHGIATALAEWAEITMIIPKSELVDENRSQISFIGINRLDLNSILKEHQEDFTNSNYQLIECEQKLSNPYLDANEYEKALVKNELSDLNDLFQSGSLYDNAIWNRIHFYQLAVQKIAESLTFDFIHCHDWMTFGAGVSLKNKFNKPLILHVHSLEYDRIGGMAENSVFSIEKASMNIADAVITVSEYTKQIAIQHYHIDSSKLFAIHNGSSNQLNLIKREKQLKKVVLFIGRMTSQKGPQTFISIAKQVLEKIDNVRFVMAGKGEQLENLIETSAQQELGNRLHFTGFLGKEDINNLLQMTDVYCMPSFSEPFGLSAIEAAEMGVPCVLSKQSGVSEILRASLLADYWDADLFAKHIITILSDEKLRESISEQNMVYTHKNTWRHTAIKIHELYQAMLHN